MFNLTLIKSNNMALAVLLLLFLYTPISVAEKELNQQQILQKIQLVEYVLADIKNKAGAEYSQNPLLKAGYDYAIDKVKEAKTAMNAGDIKQAAAFTEEAFINMSYTRSLIKKQGPSNDSYQRAYNKKSKAVNEYLDALTEELSTKDEVQARAQLEQALSARQSAKDLYDSNRYKEALRQMDMAYSLLVATLGRIKDNTTAVVALNFETPKDEYVYELKRLESFQMLLKLRKSNTEMTTKTEQMVNAFVDKSSANAAEAKMASEQQDFTLAISLLEQANENLKRALRMTGLNVF